jgi:hypothetical protein
MFITQNKNKKEDIPSFPWKNLKIQLLNGKCLGNRSLLPSTQKKNNRMPVLRLGTGPTLKSVGENISGREIH